MRAVVICNGEIKDYRYIKGFIDKEDFIICCDGGLRHCKELGVMPKLLVGDFDSVSKKLYDKYVKSGCEVLKVPAEKDFTDCELGVREAAKRGASEVTLIGCTGGRLDHTLGCCHVLIMAEGLGVKAKIVDYNSVIYALGGERVFDVKKGQIVSVLPMTEEVKGVYTDGLYYALNGESLKMGETLGISNVCVSERIKIKISEGTALVIFSRD